VPDAEWNTKLTQFEDRIGVLVDHSLVSRVRVFDLAVDEGLLRLRYEQLATPGLNHGSASEHHVLSTDARVLESSAEWRADHVGWRIFFEPGVIARVLDIVSVMPAGTTYLDDYTSRPAPEGSRFTAIRSPGPCASALHAYLRTLG
jgi:hypothetical protein